MIHHGDCLLVMPTLPAASVDSIVTDPPYGLDFMGKNWDRGVPGEAFWREALRVAKPGAFLLAFGGTRTFHRLAVAIEDAGWEIRDTLMWVYGQGWAKHPTNLKPAYEPLILARRPCEGSMISNVATHGTGALQTQLCRVGEEVGGWNGAARKNAISGEPRAKNAGVQLAHEAQPARPKVGRSPSNFLHDGAEEVLALFPESKSGGYPPEGKARSQGAVYGKPNARGAALFGPSVGSAARFYFCAKASKADRMIGNAHPTVKPTALMRYLVRLVTPPGGMVLDPFCGSGSTGKAAALEGLGFIGIEKEASYVEIAKLRLREAT